LPPAGAARSEGEAPVLAEEAEDMAQGASFSPLVSMAGLLAAAKEKKYAVAAFNIYNAESLGAVFEAAKEERSPIIVQTWRGDLEHLGIGLLVEMVRWLAKDSGLPVCLHLDHGSALEIVSACIEGGFSSVMFDGSRLPFEENVRITKEVKEAAHRRGVSVEAELGVIGRAESPPTEEERQRNLTRPEVAEEFVALTGIDALAIAIGNLHGAYKGKPQLDLDRVADIAGRTGIPLVLHGGSTTPEVDIRQAVANGICKVNVATELYLAFGRGVTQGLQKAEGRMWPAGILQQARAEMREVARHWIRLLGSAGRMEQ
jgi:ketose-bisphosphate aldolase